MTKNQRAIFINCGALSSAICTAISTMWLFERNAILWLVLLVVPQVLARAVVVGMQRELDK